MPVAENIELAEYIESVIEQLDGVSCALGMFATALDETSAMPTSLPSAIDAQAAIARRIALGLSDLL